MDGWTDRLMNKSVEQSGDTDLTVFNMPQNDKLHGHY